MSWSGWYSLDWGPLRISSITDGSRSKWTARGTYCRRKERLEPGQIRVEREIQGRSKWKKTLHRDVVAENEPYLAGGGLIEEGTNVGARRAALLDGAVRVDAMLEAVQLPARVADLNTGLSYVKRNYFSAHVVIDVAEDER